MSGKYWVLFVILTGTAVVAIFGAKAGAPAGVQPYGAKVTFQEGAAVAFKDFTVTYTGRRRVVPKQYPRGWWVYDFDVEAGGKKQKISWSSGTGAIDPTDFRVGNKGYQLELGLSEKLGQLKEDQMVISTTKR